MYVCIYIYILCIYIYIYDPISKPNCSTLDIFPISKPNCSALFNCTKTLPNYPNLIFGQAQQWHVLLHEPQRVQLAMLRFILFYHKAHPANLYQRIQFKMSNDKTEDFQKQDFNQVVSTRVGHRVAERSDIGTGIGTRPKNPLEVFITGMV